MQAKPIGCHRVANGPHILAADGSDACERSLTRGWEDRVVIQLVLPLVTTTSSSGAIMLLLWGMSFALLFIPQQQRLLIMAPAHANVILALNNSALYLEIAGGAAVGGLALRWLAVTQLA